MTVSLLASKSDPGAEADAGATRGMTAAPLLSVSGLSVSYGRLRALDDINLDVRSGELIALAGENGAGKTTLVRCVAGDVVPATGEIFLAGKRVPSDPAGAAKHGVAVVWQDLALCDNLDVAANILLGRESRRLMRSDTRFHAAAADLLNSLRIPLKDTTLSVRALSGGQRQLVAVARAMGRRPRPLALTGKVASSWSVPVLGPSGLSGVITVFRTEHGAPQRDELDLVTVYTGYAASAIERDRLLDQVTTRNRVLETIREMLETLAGPVLVGDGLVVALQSLRGARRAEEVALIPQPAGQPTRWRAYAGPQGTDPSSATPSLREMSGSALSSTNPDGVARQLHSSHRQRARAVAFVAAGGPTVLIASWRRVPPTKEETALMEDAANSLRLALEREEAGHA